MASSTPDIEQLRAELAALTERVRRLERGQAVETDLEPPPLAVAEPPRAETPTPPPHAAAVRKARPPGLAIPSDSMSLESRIGSQWLNRIGIVAVLIGVSYFLRYAFEHEWVGPSGRVAIGLLAGMAVVLWSERFRTSGYLAFSWSLKAVGVGTLYLSLWAAFQLYQLVPVGVAFGAMTAVTASTAVLALRQDAAILAAFALAGGYATPVLLSTGVSRPIELFTYVALLNAAMLAIVRSRPWVPLAGGAFIGTLALYLGWHAQFYTADDRTVALAFTTLFFAIFAAVPLLARYPAAADQRAVGTGAVWKLLAVPVLLLLPLVNGGAYFLQLMTILEPLGRDAAASAALALAAVYLALSALVRQARAEAALTPTLAMLHGAAAIGLVTMAIPLRFDAHWLTLGWLAESAALLWIGERRGSQLVTGFGVTALALAVIRLLLVDNFHPDLVLLNMRTATYGLAIALLGAIAVTGRRTDRLSDASMTVTILTLNLLALVLLSREVDDYFRPGPGAADLVVRSTAARDFTYSAVWLAYGTAIMVAGFLLRWTHVRWQALIIIGLTIVKVFVYDLSNLDQPFRTVSFIALGLVLMAISFAYQRDWLKLRDAAASSGSRRPL